MSIIKSVRGKTPSMGENCFIAENSVLVGDVTLGDNCSIWFGAVLRGDVHYIKIGDNVNIQDNAVIHATYEKSPTVIGNNVSIAHGAIVHGCTVHNNVLIGMNAVILDDAVIESNSIVAAGAVVTKGTIIRSGTVFAGSPAKKIKELSPELLENEINRIANNYHTYAEWYK
jgi:carbonic anhydrase/acetyltransferase-like protein (isoleucine patch superfamily)